MALSLRWTIRVRNYRSKSASTSAVTQLFSLPSLPFGFLRPLDLCLLNSSSSFRYHSNVPGVGGASTATDR